MSGMAHDLALAVGKAIDDAEAAQASLAGATDTSSLRALLDAREEKLLALGRAVLAWRVSGGEIELVDGEPAASPAPPEPAALPELPPPPAGPPASTESLLALIRGFHQRPASAAPLDPSTEALRVALDELGPPPDVSTPEAAGSELEVLLRAIEGARQHWTPIHRATRRDLLALCVCRARRLQETLGGPAVDALFRKMTAYSSEDRPGYVEGLSLQHQPRNGSWSADAEHWWAELRPAAPSADAQAPNPERALSELKAVIDLGAFDAERLQAAARRCLDAGLDADEPRLVKALAAHTEMLEGDRRFRALRKAARSLAASEDAEPEPDAPTWPHAAYTRGRSVVIVGGDKPELVQRLQQAFGFGDVEWDTGEHPRRLEALAARIANGSVDYAILLVRFLSHRAWELLDPAFRSSGTRRIVVDQGVGLSAVRQALEQALVGEPVTEAEPAPSAGS